MKVSDAMKKAHSDKLGFAKTTLKNLTVHTGIEAGGCSKNWSYAQSHDANGCRGGSKQQ
jgi:hypothetical protein